MGPKRDARAPPLPFPEICPRLALKVSSREARAIVRRLRDYDTPSRNSQILALLAIIHDELHYDWSHRDIGSVFNVNKGTVHRIRSEAMEEMKHETGRAPLLSEDQETQVIAFIASNFEGGSPVAPKQIRLYGSETFAICVSSSWTWRFVVRHRETLQPAIAYPQEDKRMKVTKEIARAHIRNLERWVKNLPTELILNFDEVGVQEWADRKKRKVIIPYQAQPRRVEYAVTRKEKRISCIATISIAGDALMPLLVIHRRTIDDAVWEDGWRDGQDFMIRSNSSSYVTREIIREYLTQVLMPYVETSRIGLRELDWIVGE
jgi:hypothetical protein